MIRPLRFTSNMSLYSLVDLFHPSLGFRATLVSIYLVDVFLGI